MELKLLLRSTSASASTAALMNAMTWARLLHKLLRTIIAPFLLLTRLDTAAASLTTKPLAVTLLKASVKVPSTDMFATTAAASPLVP
jgi:hypothetical protein